MPVSHSFGLIAGVLSAIARETEPVIVTDRNPKFAFHAIRSIRKPVVYAVPFLLQLLLQLGTREFRFHRLVTSGAPLTERLLSQLIRDSGKVWQQYGCTEAGCISIGAVLDSPTNVGKPLGHLKVSLRPVSAAETDEPAGDDPVQEIVVESGASAIETRDAGRMTEDGVLHVLGRMDDVINVSGLKVFPSEVERVI